MKIVERMANDARFRWFGSKEQSANYFGNEFNAGFAYGFQAAKDIAIEDAVFHCEQMELIGEQEVEGDSVWGYETLIGDKWETVK